MLLTYKYLIIHTKQTRQKKWNNMWNIFNVCRIMLILIVCDGNMGIASFSLSTTEYPSSRYDLYSTYNNESDYPDCIFVFGGQTSGTDEGLYCFSISNHSLIQFDTLQVQSDNIYPRGNPGALMWRNVTDENDYIYYIFRRSSAPYIKRYNLDILGDEYLTTLSGFTWGACMQFNPFNGSEILLVESSGNAFGVYNIEDNTFTLGESLHHAISRQACVVIDNEYMPDEPYFYVFGYGYIQRLNLNNGNVAINTAWENVQGSLEVNDADCSFTNEFRAHLLSNLVFLIGGYDGINALDCIVSYNILTNTSNYAGFFPTTLRRFTAMLCIFFLFISMFVDVWFVSVSFCLLCS